MLLAAFGATHHSGESVSELWAAADTSPRKPPVIATLHHCLNWLGQEAPGQEKTRPRAIAYDSGRWLGGYSFGEVGLSKSAFADVGEKAVLLGLLLTAYFFPSLPFPSEAGIVYAHVNVCIKLNS